MDLANFEVWLRNEGKTIATIANYSTAVGRALKVIGLDRLDQVAIDGYSAEIDSIGGRNAFRVAWGALVRWAASQGVGLPALTPLRQGRPPTRLLASARPEDFAIAYLARAIPLWRLTNEGGDGTGLRWTDVEFTSPADAIITDSVEHSRYHVHRRALDVLLTWGRPDGSVKGALVPNVPGDRWWISKRELGERIARAQEAAARPPITNPVAAFIAALSAPRVVSWKPKSVDPDPRTA